MTWRRSTAYPCASLGCDEPGAWVEHREIKPNGLPASVGFYGACETHHAEQVANATQRATQGPQKHEKTRGADALSSGVPIREVPLGIAEIAQLLEVKRGTVNMWRAREVLPEPDGFVSDSPYWWRETILAFAQRTGRMPA